MNILSGKLKRSIKQMVKGKITKKQGLIKTGCYRGFYSHLLYMVSAMKYFTYFAVYEQHDFIENNFLIMFDLC